jgi:DNA-nicking Smr family endonuclease
MTESVTPLVAKPAFSDKLSALPIAPEPETKPLLPGQEPKSAKQQGFAPPKAQLPPLRQAPSAPAAYLKHGEAQGIDRRKLKRMQRGKLDIQARLDLHGFTQSQAQAAVIEFLERCQAQDKRNVIIVTGKGNAKEGGGILRARLPDWLNLPPNRQRVLSYDYSQPKDGGTGALYVVLRKARSAQPAPHRAFARPK